MKSVNRLTGPIRVELIKQGAKANPGLMGKREAPGMFIKATVKAGKGRRAPKWEGFAAFPKGMEEEAEYRAQNLVTPNDIEDLMREFSDEATYNSFLKFREGYPQDVRLMKPKMIEVKKDTSTLLSFDEYDLVIVSFSGGKDSLACVLNLLDLGVPKEKMELWHQAVDGRPGQDPRFFDWPCTESYCRAIAKGLGITFKLQWREGGFLGEMTKGDPSPRPTAPVGFEKSEGGLEHGDVEMTIPRGAPQTRMKFPAVAADLQTRWCSSVLKIDVAISAITNDPRFVRRPGMRGGKGKVLIVTGERRQESGPRSGYATVLEYGSTTLTRRVDQWRSVLEWREEEVWDIIERYRVRPHPAYYLGWGRVSCFPCIFGSPNQWAAIKRLDPEQFKKILGYEHRFGHTIQAGEDIEARASRGKSFVPDDPENIRLAMTEDYPEELAIVPDDEDWKLPLGAYDQVDGNSGGPV